MGWISKYVDPRNPPRTRGMRNPGVASANAHKGGPMRDKRDRRSKDTRRSWKAEVWS